LHDQDHPRLQLERIERNQPLGYSFTFLTGLGDLQEALNKSIPGFSEPAKQQTRLLLCSIFQTVAC
jgi:hypothetical protein